MWEDESVKVITDPEKWKGTGLEDDIIKAPKTKVRTSGFGNIS